MTCIACGAQEKESKHIWCSKCFKERHYIEIFIEANHLDAMGKVIDLARISGMSDRSFDQFEKTVKRYYYDLMKFNINELNAKGYVPKREEKSAEQ
jgi:hypothetical protein